jgi:putative transposase
MARLARLVVPDLPHHVTQRGNRKQDVFFEARDYRAYLALVAAACERESVRCLAWCLMPNHLHLILMPAAPEGLRRALGEAHRRYSRRVNEAHDWTGYLFQGRFASFVMDPAHLMVAVRYVELNPVRAGLASRARDWPWSSARAHIAGRGDGLTDLAGLAGAVRNWSAMLERGLEAGDDMADAAIEAHSRTGRPWGDDSFLARLEAATGRKLLRRRPGPKPRR